MCYSIFKHLILHFNIFSRHLRLAQERLGDSLGLWIHIAYPTLHFNLYPEQHYIKKYRQNIIYHGVMCYFYVRIL